MSHLKQTSCCRKVASAPLHHGPPPPPTPTMLRCRSCVQNRLSVLISIHSLVRPFTASAIVGAGARMKSSKRSSRSDARRPPEAPPSAGKPRLGNFTHVPLPRLNGHQHGETRDPLRLAAHVEEYLAVDDVARAHRAVELAASKIDTVISWNRLIAHSMNAHNVKRAFRFYNDVTTSQPFSFNPKHCCHLDEKTRHHAG